MHVMKQIKGMKMHRSRCTDTHKEQVNLSGFIQIPRKACLEYSC